MSSRVVQRWAIALAGVAAVMVTTLGGGAVGAAATAAAPAADAYAIKLNRPLRVGDKFAFTADAAFVQTLTADLSGGQTRTLQPLSLSVHFDGTEEILAVGPRGEPTRAAYTVAACTAREGKQQVAVVQPGHVVTVDAGKWKSQMDVDQGAFTIQDDFFARMVLSLPNLGHVGDDECFGSDKPQKVGDAWPARPDPLVQSFASAPGMKVKKQNVSGTIKLAGLEAVDGVPCLRVQGKIKVEHFLPPATDLPERSKAQDATYEYKFPRLITADPAGPCLSDSHSTTLLLKLRLDDPTLGSDIVVNGKLLRTVGIKRRPVPG